MEGEYTLNHMKVECPKIMVIILTPNQRAILTTNATVITLFKDKKHPTDAK